jgi:hypothetical protein
MSRKQMIEECLEKFDNVTDFTKQMLFSMIDKKSKNGEYILQDVSDLVSLVRYLEDLKNRNFF